jgi:N-acetylneuraminic acid mutarotase
LLLFGGRGREQQSYDDLYRFDSATMTWHAIDSTLQPTARAFATMAIRDANAAVMCGGSGDGGARFDDLWLLLLFCPTTATTTTTTTTATTTVGDDE